LRHASEVLVQPTQSPVPNTIRKIKPHRKRAIVPSLAVVTEFAAVKDASAEESNAETNVLIGIESPEASLEQRDKDEVAHYNRNPDHASDEDAEGDTDDDHLQSKDKGDWDAELGMWKSDIRALQFGTRHKHTRGN
jgi:hypothetical protein